MVLHDEQYEAYIQILKEELIPAFGCTEPIALAYAASDCQTGAWEESLTGESRGKRKYYKKCKERHCA